MTQFGFGSGKYWLRPPAVLAPKPENKEETTTYVISEQYVYAHRNSGRIAPIFQLWAHVVGELPPINNISRLERGSVKPTLTKLTHSVACFRGVNRPYDDEENGASVLVYVLNPTVTVVREVDMVCLATAAIVPRNTALTVQVKPLRATGNADLQGASEALHTGIITRLEFVPAGPGNPLLPENHAERYAARLW